LDSNDEESSYLRDADMNETNSNNEGEEASTSASPRMPYR